MRYLSVCSGIEAASVAWHGLGWTPAAFSEIEAFPRAVLKHRFPDVPVHGDFTTIGADQYGPVELLVGGTPCQSFSVAGKRGGMGDDRGNLALEYIRLAHRKRARWVVWENVPGVFSSNGGEDFRCFLAGLVRWDVPLPEGGWQNSGVIAAGPADGAYGVAWRVLDAQYAGVPQRRRRVFVVGYIGDWRRAAAVLLERESLSGDHPPSRKARQGTAASFEGSSDGGGGSVGTLRTRRPGEGGVQGDFDHVVPDISPALNTQSGSHHAPDTKAYVACNTWPAEVAPCLDSHFGDKMGQEDQHIRGGAGLFVPVYATDGQTNAAFAEDQALALTSHNEQPYVALPQVVGALTGKGPQDLGAPQVDADHYIVAHNPLGHGAYAEGVGTLRAKGGDVGPGSETLIAFGAHMSGTQASAGKNDICPSLQAKNPQAIAFTCKDSGQDAGEISPTLRAMAEGDGNANAGGQIAVTIPLLEVGARTGDEDPKAGIGIGEDADPMFTLQSSKQHGVAVFDPNQVTSKTNRSNPTPEVSHALPATANAPVAFPIDQNALRGDSGAKTPSPDAEGNVRLRDPGLGIGADGDPAPTLNAAGPAAVATSAVRRLTPVECERLQGFPDNFTLVPYRGKPAADGPRYKALGNSMAVPVMAWIGKRIALVEAISAEEDVA